MSTRRLHNSDGGGFLLGSQAGPGQMENESNILNGLMSNLGIGGNENACSWFPQSAKGGPLSAWNDDTYSTDFDGSPTNSIPVPQPKRIVPQNMLFNLLEEDNQSNGDAGMNGSDSIFGLGKLSLATSQSMERMDEGGRGWPQHETGSNGSISSLGNSGFSNPHTPSTNAMGFPSFSDASPMRSSHFQGPGIGNGLLSESAGSVRAQSTPLYGSLNWSGQNQFGQGLGQGDQGQGPQEGSDNSADLQQPFQQGNGQHNGMMGNNSMNQIPLLQSQMQQSANQFKHLNNMSNMNPQQIQQLRQLQHMQQLQQLQQMHQSQSSVPQLPPNLQSHLVDLDKKMEVRRGKLVAPVQQMQNGAGGYSRQRGGPQGQRPYQTPPPSMESYLYQRQHQQMPAGKPGQLNLCGLEDSSVEDIVAKTCRDILIEAANHTLKAVELANTLRARVGTEVLAHVRERWSGLLSLLERRQDMFRVERIPKNDLVTLISTSNSAIIGTATAATASGASVVAGAGVGTESSPGTDGHVNRRASPGLPDGAGRTRPQSRTPPLATDANGVFEDRSAVQSRMGSRNSVGPSPDGHSGHQHEGHPSRCLHVGNVPANLNEAQLMAEFSQFGEIDLLKVVTQRNRRFAFISFKTLECAVNAKQKMSKTHSWKSAISFAHKESYGTHSGSSTPELSDHHLAHGTHGNHGAHSRPPTSMSGNSMSQLQEIGGAVVSPNMKTTSVIGDAPRTTNATVIGQDGGSGPYVNTLGNDFRASTSSPKLQSSIFGGQGHAMGGPHMRSTTVSPSLQSQQAWERENGSIAHASAPKAQNDVLRRLCDDTYVPTQQWPIDPAMDALYCNAVVSQLKQFGCTTTISKLRGFLRNRLAATDNIKSVPLKAMLAAYPGLFIVHGNQVSLVQQGMHVMQGMQGMQGPLGHQPHQHQHFGRHMHAQNHEMDSISSVAATLGSSQLSMPLTNSGLSSGGSSGDLQQHGQLHKLQQLQHDQQYSGAISVPYRQPQPPQQVPPSSASATHPTQQSTSSVASSLTSEGSANATNATSLQIAPVQQIKNHALGGGGGHGSSFDFGIQPMATMLSSDALSLSTHSESTTQS